MNKMLSDYVKDKGMDKEEESDDSEMVMEYFNELSSGDKKDILNLLKGMCEDKKEDKKEPKSEE